MAELAKGSDDSRLPRVKLEAGEYVWDELLGPARKKFIAALEQAIARQRWFGAKSRKRQALQIVEAIALGEMARLLLVEVLYDSGPSEVYQVPLAIGETQPADLEQSARWIAVHRPAGSLLLYDPLGQDDFAQELLALIASERVIDGQAGQLTGSRTDRFEQCHGSEERLPSKLLGAEQSNSSIAFDERLVLKVFRRVERGINPDLEITGYLTARDFKYVAPLAGSFEFRPRGDSSWSLAVLQQYVPNRGDAWSYYLETVTDFVKRKISEQEWRQIEVRSSAEISAAARERLPQKVREVFAEFIPRVERLAERTAGLHIALASSTDDPAFTPEPFTRADHRRFREAAAALAREAFALLGRHLDDLKPEVRKRAESLLSAAPQFDRRYTSNEQPDVEVAKTRCHGDYHLGQVLVTADDYVIIDFEGEPARPLEERRRKQLALRDVAGMLRSFHYVGCTVASSMVDHRDAQKIERITAAWYFWMSVVFVAAYRRSAAGGVFLPANDEQFDAILSECLLEKATYELKYELNNRPDWVYLPVTALCELLGLTTAQGA
ncbi:MAG TPA: putative maltokinase [Pirellulales bacterium]